MSTKTGQCNGKPLIVAGHNDVPKSMPPQQSDPEQRL